MKNYFYKELNSNIAGSVRGIKHDRKYQKGECLFTNFHFKNFIDWQIIERHEKEKIEKYNENILQGMKMFE